jgi:methionyl-tRNA synthetase
VAFRDHLFQFDAPIGYPSITANYTPEWKQWWFNPEDVNLYQFMGKDNVYFHTVYFPSVQIADGRNWTTLHHISTTGEFSLWAACNAMSLYHDHRALQNI